ncbi:MAG: bifunctional phosphoribosylaminoimidazolecarboxamide formyltransferase/IMP cyclohydrolase [Armatimonadota bacterium]|nr:bifunctional phosphoribosylaminoimidazolecarboxamide formyltransferase/IMP cyclohydrolase [Armatimonadota bacterium]MDR7570025.1 bifunctional phosphoribosylaminoimidazolecarboxamide formyltransferase/IMP cyclohydrolase [Armatimonadota bacterium]MDR7615189.1 bifunctional phosphoribosylaminoimidazolecarboxamide formyltransferase/IMP cyclohydrolase [Armatimonadota bacterium]
MPRALLSVTDKTGLVDFARGLWSLGFEIVSTGGTARVLREAGIPVTSVAEVTGFPEVLGGRVKTLHPAIHAAVLARRSDEEELERLGIKPVEVVAVNLYRFEEAAAANRPWEELVEEIDVGGVALIRAAAKNSDRVAVLTDPGQYGPVLEELRRTGEVLPETRRRLAVEAFRYVAGYDALIARVLAERSGQEEFPERLVWAWRRDQALRYGENPHQAAAFYRDPLAPPGSLPRAEQVGGRPLSYNNLLDADAAWRLVWEFSEPAAVVVKHANPCGCALGPTAEEALRGALRGDPISRFGGIVALNRPLDGPAARLLREVFLEVVVAPGFTPEALEILRGRQNLRILQIAPPAEEATWEIRSVLGGVLVQEPDRVTWQKETLRVVTSRVPTPEEWEDLRFAWVVCKHTKSNAVVLARGREVVGVGAGQMSRVDSVRLAVAKAGERARGAVLASDAFFPFPDGVEEAVRAGVVAIVQPGGSVRDPEVIAAAERAGCSMVFTGIRHFRH